MRLLLLGVATLLLAGCGGEKYQVPASQAYTTLTGVGTPSAFYPLPGGLNDVSVRFEALPADNAVQWHFTHEGDDLAKIVAMVEPSGDDASNVSVFYVEGSAPDENWRNGAVRNQLSAGVYQLVTEAVDARLENRSVDQTFVATVRNNITMASMGGMMNDASSAMDKAVERQKERERERESQGATNPYGATKPATDLSKFN